MLTRLAQITPTLCFLTFFVALPANAETREEKRVVDATNALDQLLSIPEKAIPPTLLARAYAIAVIPNVVKVCGIFSAQHGSWDRTTPIGARVMFTAVNDDGSAGESGPFAEGWIDENEEYLGRPVAIAQLRDGSILVSDDLAGAVYRISYGM